MKERLAAINIILSEREAVEPVNELLFGYRDLILGRMGLPLKEYGVWVISIIIGASQDEISALSGKLGRISHVTAKVNYAPEKA